MGSTCAACGAEPKSKLLRWAMMSTFWFVFLNRPITKLNGLNVHSTLYIVLLSWDEQWKWIFSYIAASQLTHHNHNSSSNNNCLNSSVIAHNFLVISLEDILPHFQGRATDLFDHFLWKDLCLPLFLATSTPFPRILIRPLPWKDLRRPDYFWRPLLPSREPAHFRGWSFTSLLFSEETRRAPQ